MLLIKLFRPSFRLFVQVLTTVILVFAGVAQGSSDTVPETSEQVVSALASAQWSELESGLDVIRAITESGIIMTAYRVSSEEFEFSVVTQKNDNGSQVKEIGEAEGAVLATNAGFFAERSNGSLYPIGFLRLDGEVVSKGWESEGGVLSWGENSLTLTPSHAGIPDDKFNALQSRPMLIEPGSRWAMGSNLGEISNRTLLCMMGNGDVILALVTRVGMSLFEAGWILRDPEAGGFFGCDAAMALDGGRSTQVWYSGNQRYSFPGLVPVHNFLVVRAKER